MAFDLSTATPVEESGFDLASARPVEAETPKSKTNLAREVSFGPVDTALSLASGAVAGPLSGLTGLVGAALPGEPGQGARVVGATQNLFTYHPRTETGKAVTKAVAAPFEWLAGKADQAGEAVSDATGSPLAGAAVNTAIQGAPLLLGKGAKALGIGEPESAASAAARSDLRSMNSRKDTTLRDARAEGYVVPPSAVERSFIGNRIEGLGGKAAIGQEASLRNQEITNKIARREAGIAERDPITEGTLEAARTEMAEPYREVAALSPRAASALTKLQEARLESKLQWGHFKKQGDPKAYRAAEAADGKAAMLETVIEREAARAGNPDLVENLRAARTAIAKNYAVERALNVGSGDVDAMTIGRMLDKGEPLSDGLRVIGRFAQAFGPYAREAPKVPTPGVSKLEALASVGLGGVGSSIFGPAGVVLAALPFASGAARQFMLSKGRQKPRTYERGAVPRLLSSPAAGVLSKATPYAGVPLGMLEPE